jgi:MFS family permease
LICPPAKIGLTTGEHTFVICKQARRCSLDEAGVAIYAPLFWFSFFGEYSFFGKSHMRFGLQIAPRLRVCAMFFIYALVLGGIYPRLGDLQRGMNIEEGALGAALAGMAIGTQIAFMFVAPLLARFGHRAALLICIPMLGIAETVAALSPSPMVFFLVLIVAGLFVGTIELVINLEADRTEHLLGRRLMNRAHAFWSFGFFAAGLIAALAKQSGIGALLHLGGMAVLALVLTIVVFARFEQAKPRLASDGPPPRLVRPTMGILLVVAFTLSAMLMEGAGIDWSVIYMRDVFATAPLVNGLAFALGALSMAVARFFADGFIDRFGPFHVARVMVLILGAGTALVAFAPYPLVALFGFVLIGAGGSVMFPMAISAAAQRTDRPAATNVAALAQIAFVTFLVAPPLLGFVAERFGIRVSFGLGLPLVVLSWFMLFVLRPPKPAKSPA